MGSLGLPTLDASALRGSSHKRADFARSLLEGLSDQGLVKLVDHGIPDQEVEEVFDAVCALSNLSVLLSYQNSDRGTVPQILSPATRCQTATG